MQLKKLARAKERITSYKRQDEYHIYSLRRRDELYPTFPSLLCVVLLFVSIGFSCSMP